MHAEADKSNQSTISPMDIPRMVNRRAGDNKKKVDTDDIFDLWERLDAGKVELPSFYAVNLTRIPPLSFTSADVCCLSALVHDMKQQLDNMQGKIGDLSERIQPSSHLHVTGPPAGAINASLSLQSNINRSVQPSSTAF